MTRTHDRMVNENLRIINSVVNGVNKVGSGKEGLKLLFDSRRRFAIKITKQLNASLSDAASLPLTWLGLASERAMRVYVYISTW